MRRALALASSIAALLWLPLSAPAQSPDEPADDPTSEEQTAAEEEAAELAEPEELRASFNVRLDEASGGGRVIGSADDFDFRPGQLLVATGDVEIKYRDLTLTGQTVRLDIPDNRLTAEGDVVLDEGPERISGDVLEYDLDTRTGRVTNAKAQVEGDIFFSGSEIAKTGDITYTIEDGEFTSCEGDSPAWSFALSDASITLEEYARIRNARLRFGKVPVLYVPYILWPATTERSSGWLIPRPGYSDRRGAQIGLAYYRTLGRSADMTFYLDASTEEYFGAGAEYRYRPSEDTNGIVEAYYLSEPDIAFTEAVEENRVFDPTREAGDDRWKLTWAHETKNLWDRFRGVINLQLYSDFDYLRDVERNTNRQTRSYTYSNAYLSANEGPHSFNVMIDQRELINSNGTRNTRRQVPEIEYRLRPTQLGGLPIYFSLQSSANAFQVEFEPTIGDNAGTKTTIEYARADFAPAISAPLSSLPWLSVKATLAGRATYYTDSLPEQGSPEAMSDDPLAGGSLTRTFPSARLDVIGPRFSRVFDLSGDRFAKLKHIIEPRFTYTWVDEFDDAERISVFDEIDTFRPVNATQVALVNRFLAKPRDEEEGGAFEIASLEVSKVYIHDDFDENPNNDVDGPIITTMRLNPSEETSFKGEWQYDENASQLISQSLSGGTKLWDRHQVGLTYYTRWRASDGEETSDQIRLFTKFEIIPDKLYFDAQVGYNLLDNFTMTNPELDRLQEQRYLIDFRSQCYSWLLEYRETNYASFEDSELRFSLSLRNVGTFLDLNESFD